MVSLYQTLYIEINYYSVHKTHVFLQNYEFLFYFNKVHTISLYRERLDK